jgi:hypothetical protein
MQRIIAKKIELSVVRYAVGIVYSGLFIGLVEYQ